MMINKEIDKLIKKTNYSIQESYDINDIKYIDIYIIYNKETENIIKLKKLIEKSGKYQWEDDDEFFKNSIKNVIVISEKPIPEGTANI